MPRSSSKAKSSGKPRIIRVDFYGSLQDPEEIHEGWWCPFCECEVTMKQKAHLMICTRCNTRID